MENVCICLNTSTCNLDLYSWAHEMYEPNNVEGVIEISQGLAKTVDDLPMKFWLNRTSAIIGNKSDVCLFGFPSCNIGDYCSCSVSWWFLTNDYIPQMLWGVSASPCTWYMTSSKQKHIPRYWSLVRRIHWSPVDSPRKRQSRRALMFSFICS